MWVTKLLISPVKKGFFAPKRPNLAQNWHFWSIMCPVGESVGGCGARAVSRKTPIYFILISNLTPSVNSYGQIVRLVGQFDLQGTAKF